jgi:hypothetical protein
MAFRPYRVFFPGKALTINIFELTKMPASRVTVLFVKQCIIFGCLFPDFDSFAWFLSQIVSLYLPNNMLCKRLRNTNDELVPGSFIFVPGFRDKKYQSKTKCGKIRTQTISFL